MLGYENVSGVVVLYYFFYPFAKRMSSKNGFRYQTAGSKEKELLKNPTYLKCIIVPETTVIFLWRLCGNGDFENVYSLNVRSGNSDDLKFFIN